MPTQHADFGIRSMLTPGDPTPSLFPDLPQVTGDANAERTAKSTAESTAPARKTRPEGAAILPATLNPEVLRIADALPKALYLGTSSWSFPGWAGLVYAGNPSETALARGGLSAYARHPLFRSVGVDKTFYRPAPRAEFERLAAQVPSGFRFLVKMWRGVVERDVRGAARGTGAATTSEAPLGDAFLNARVAEVECVRPAIEGLGDKAGPLLFQFPPLHLGGGRAHRGFLAQLSNFLGALPKGPLYAVELRNRSLVSADYAPRLGDLLAEHGVAPCLTVHPTMPDVETQSRELAVNPALPLVMRWMLRANHAYGEAKDLYAPFDRVVEPDDASRDALARLARGALRAGLGAWVIVNNKAEGSSPLSVERLARKVCEV
jgi:uncharacterized protein YecE (DUF72 family)